MMNNVQRPSFVVAVDGHAAAGKGTLAKRIVDAYDFAFLDTGRLYRLVGYLVLMDGGNPGNLADVVNAAQNIDHLFLSRPELLTEQVAAAASKVSVFPQVRDRLNEFQRNFCTNPPAGAPGAVLDGRDIGTVIWPQAQVKIFLTATAEERAQRRYDELLARNDAGGYASYEALFAMVKERDARDENREVAPLRAADDAVVLDSTGRSPDDIFLDVRSIIDRSYHPND